MGFIDAITERSFRDTEAGRVVVFPGRPRTRGHLVRSLPEERKIRSFLEMFYFAHFGILAFGTMLSQGCASWIANAMFDRPALHPLATVSLVVAIYGLIVGVPYAFLWRAYKRALTSFVVREDEVSLTGTGAHRRQWLPVAVAGLALLVLAAILVLTARPAVR